MAEDSSVANREANLNCCSWHSQPKSSDHDLAAFKSFNTKQLNPASCQSLRISYRDPSFSDRLTEDVFLDPRDALNSSEDGLLLVSSHGVSALQQQSDRENHWVESVHAVINNCRHDYLREHQYLLEELRKISKMAPKELDGDVRTLLDGAMAVTEEAAEDAKLVVGTEDARALSESVGPSYAQDQELVRFLENSDLARDLADELVARLILKGMRADTERLRLERDREQEAVQAIEGPDETDDEGTGGIRKLMETMLWKARDDGAGVNEIIDDVLLRVTSAEDRQDIEDAITKELRTRFGALLAHLEEMKPKIDQWRAALRQSQTREARIQALSLQVAEAEEQLRQIDVPGHEKHQLEPEVPSWDAMDHLPPEKQLLLKTEEQAVTMVKRRQNKLRYELEQAEHRVHNYSETEISLRSNLTLAEQGLADAHDRLASLELAEVAAQEALECSTAAEAEIRQQREEIEDQHAAAKKPSLKVVDTTKIEEELQQARIRNEELQAEEQQIQMREQEYEVRFRRTEESWKAELEERAASALAAELAATEMQTSVAACEQPKGPSDPLLHAYSGRASLPEFSQVSRFDLLHGDSEARKKRLTLNRVQRNASEKEFAPAVTHHECAQEVTPHECAQEAKHTSIGSGSCSRSMVPVTFRRPEDLRIRLALAQQSLEQLSQCSVESNKKGVHYHAEMQRLGKALADSVIASSRLHVSIAGHFAEQLDGTELRDCAARDELNSVLKLQLECASRAELLANETELACEHGAEHRQMLLTEEDCAQSDRDLCMATDQLGRVEMQATQEGANEIALLAKYCCEGFAGAQYELFALVKARKTTWSKVLSMATMLMQERVAQHGIARALRAEEVRRNLFGAELVAPPQARRALAAMRAARSGAGTPQGMLLH